MIDLHTHILPGVDDGPLDMDGSVALARAMVDDGITTVVATPHAFHPMFSPTPADCDAALSSLTDRLTAESIPLTVLPGAECHLPSRSDMVFKSPNLRLNRGRWVLLEWPLDMDLILIRQLVFDAGVAGVSVLLAHAERHPGAKRRDDVSELVRAGLRLQVNADNLANWFAGSSGRIAKRLLRDGLVHVIATDAHDVGLRRPRLSEALAVAKKIIGPSAEDLVFKHPASMIAEGREKGGLKEG
jgi:protein-tyrosine phosphatase